MLRMCLELSTPDLQVKREGGQAGAVALLRSQSELLNRQLAEDLAVSEPAEQQHKAPSALKAKRCRAILVLD